LTFGISFGECFAKINEMGNENNAGKQFESSAKFLRILSLILRFVSPIIINNATQFSNQPNACKAGVMEIDQIRLKRAHPM